MILRTTPIRVTIDGIIPKKSVRFVDVDSGLQYFLRKEVDVNSYRLGYTNSLTLPVESSEDVGVYELTFFERYAIWSRVLMNSVYMSSKRVSLDSCLRAITYDPRKSEIAYEGDLYGKYLLANPQWHSDFLNVVKRLGKRVGKSIPLREYIPIYEGPDAFSRYLNLHGVDGRDIMDNNPVAIGAPPLSQEDVNLLLVNLTVEDIREVTETLGRTYDCHIEFGNCFPEAFYDTPAVGHKSLDDFLESDFSPDICVVRTRQSSFILRVIREIFTSPNAVLYLVSETENYLAFLDNVSSLLQSLETPRTWYVDEATPSQDLNTVTLKIVSKPKKA